MRLRYVPGKHHVTFTNTYFFTHPSCAQNVSSLIVQLQRAMSA